MVIKKLSRVLLNICHPCSPSAPLLAWVYISSHRHPRHPCVILGCCSRFPAGQESSGHTQYFHFISLWTTCVINSLPSYISYSALHQSFYFSTQCCFHSEKDHNEPYLPPSLISVWKQLRLSEKTHRWQCDFCCTFQIILCFTLKPPKLIGN